MARKFVYSKPSQSLKFVAETKKKVTDQYQVKKKIQKVKDEIKKY